jgi:hypothetical protein
MTATPASTRFTMSHSQCQLCSQDHCYLTYFWVKKRVRHVYQSSSLIPRPLITLEWPGSVYLLLAYLSPCYEFVPKHSSENVLQSKVRLYQTPSCGHHGQLEWTYHADLRDERLKGWSETEGDRTIGI